MKKTTSVKTESVVSKDIKWGVYDHLFVSHNEIK